MGASLASAVQRLLGDEKVGAWAHTELPKRTLRRAA